MTTRDGMKALILAGGLGTRLQSVLKDRPKPMAKAGGKPFLEYLVEQLRAQGFRELVFCLGHLADQVHHYFGDGQPWGVQIDYSVETQLLGTAGAIKNAQHFIDATFLVLNGDSYLDTDLRSVVQSHRRRHNANPRTVGTIAAVAVDEAAAYGTLELGPQMRIVRFREKASTGWDWINGGAYVLEPQLLDFIPAGQVVSIERETFPLVLQRGYRLYAYPVEGFFVDIGTPEGYRSFQRYIDHNQHKHHKGPSCPQE